jgi:hypothetical protein
MAEDDAGASFPMARDSEATAADTACALSSFTLVAVNEAIAELDTDRALPICRDRLAMAAVEAESGFPVCRVPVAIGEDDPARGLPVCFVTEPTDALEDCAAFCIWRTRDATVAEVAGVGLVVCRFRVATAVEVAWAETL